MCSLGTLCGWQATEVQPQHLSGCSASNLRCSSYFPLGGIHNVISALPEEHFRSGRPSTPLVCSGSMLWIWSVKAKRCSCCPCSNARSWAHGAEDIEARWPPWREDQCCCWSWGMLGGWLEGCATCLLVSPLTRWCPLRSWMGVPPLCLCLFVLFVFSFMGTCSGLEVVWIKICVYIPSLSKVGFIQGLWARESEYKSKMKTEEMTALYAQSTYLHWSKSIAAPRCQPPSQLSCHWGLRATCRSGSWIVSGGDLRHCFSRPPSGTFSLGKRARLRFRTSHFLAKPWSLGCWNSLCDADHQQCPAPSAPHPISQVSQMGRLLNVGFTIAALLYTFTHYGWFQGGHRHDYMPSVTSPMPTT